ncbi:MAG: class I SAM-dependent methyltransferase [Tissierellia bacterium]|nr:class I SAM-dependent methyltransferase [Tissierellia bacterium]
MKNSYKEFSQIYDLLMDIDYEQWTNFIIDKLQDRKTVLEAACGTGSVTKILADNNYKITAFDLSEDMLMRAYEKLKRSPMVGFLKLDMVNFKIDSKFEAAICCCDGVNYLNKDEAGSFFERVYKHLKNDSKFIFDISTKYKYDTIFNDTYVYEDENIFYVWENINSEGIINIEINFFLKDEDKYTRITEEQIQYVHKTEEILNMLKDVGFKDVEVFDDYSQESYSDTSLRAVFLASKAD